MTVPVSDLQSIAPSSIIELFELALDPNLQGSSDVWRFHNGSNTNNNSELIWNGQSYMRYPIEFGGVEYSGKGTLPQPKLRISNIMGTATALLLAANEYTSGNDLIGAKLTRIRTLAKYIDAANFPGGVNATADPTVEFPREIFYLSQKSAETREVVEFICSSSFDLQGVNAPKRQCISNVCQWKYRSSECGYSEAAYYDANDSPVSSISLDVCGKRLNSCKARFNSVFRTGSVVKNSTTMTVNLTAGLSEGQPIFGFGVPSGTTVSSITSDTALVMSAAATVSTTQTQSATPSATVAGMTVTNGSNLRVGISVSGDYIPSGTTITTISGNTTTLSARPYQLVKSATAYVLSYRVGVVVTTIRSITINTTGLSAGMRVFGSARINATIASVGSGSITLSSYGSLPANGTALTLYFMPPSPSAATYAFSASTAMTFRTTDGILPYGSFPSVGLYE
jgi:lambda family phage minor tail protein L